MNSTENRKFNRIPPGLEKRRHLRVALENVTVEVYDAQGEPEGPEVCPILNLSEAGMLFETHNDYQENQHIRLTFMLPNSIVIIRTNAEVVHQYWQSESGFVGVRFQKIGVSEKANIRSYVGKNEKSAVA